MGKIVCTRARNWHVLNIEPPVHQPHTPEQAGRGCNARVVSCLRVQRVVAERQRCPTAFEACRVCCHAGSGGERLPPATIALRTVTRTTTLGTVLLWPKGTVLAGLTLTFSSTYRACGVHKGRPLAKHAGHDSLHIVPWGGPDGKSLMD